MFPSFWLNLSLFSPFFNLSLTSHLVFCANACGVHHPVAPIPVHDLLLLAGQVDQLLGAFLQVFVQRGQVFLPELRAFLQKMSIIFRLYEYQNENSLKKKKNSRCSQVVQSVSL